MLTEAEIKENEELDRLIAESEMSETDGPTEKVDNPEVKEEIPESDDLQDKDTPESEESENLDDEVKADEESTPEGDNLGDKPTEKDDNPSNQDLTLITDKDINTFSEKDQKILQRFKGKPIAEGLKSLVEAQRMVGKGFKKENIPTEESLIPDPVKQPEEAKTYKDQVILNNMSNLHDDFPKDAYEWSELQSDNPTKYFQYLSEHADMVKSINTQFDTATHIINNFEDINNEILNESGSKIVETVKNFGLDVNKDFGIDITRDKEGANEYLDSLLVNSDGKLDLNLFETWKNAKGETKLRFGVPQIKEGAVEQKFIKQNLPLLMMKVREKAFIEGVSAANSKTLPPSFSDGVTPQRKNPDKIDPRNITDLDALDRAIEESENSE